VAKLSRCILLAGVLVLALVPGLASAQADAVASGVPLAIDIPSIGTHAQVVPLGQDENGAMQAPTDPDTVGWYNLGAGVGAPGNALLDGHVDWGGRLRVFGLLKQLEPGDPIQITDASGNVLTYNVVWTRLYSADSAPLAEIFEQGNDQELTLITCGGAFDRSAHMYVSRWVVRATRTPTSAETSAN